jgi:hypothetical protein
MTDENKIVSMDTSADPVTDTKQCDPTSKKSTGTSFGQLAQPYAGKLLKMFQARGWLRTQGSATTTTVEYEQYCLTLLCEAYGFWRQYHKLHDDVFDDGQTVVIDTWARMVQAYQNQASASWNLDFLHSGMLFMMIAAPASRPEVAYGYADLAEWCFAFLWLGPPAATNLRSPQLALQKAFRSFYHPLNDDPCDITNWKPLRLFKGVQSASEVDKLFLADTTLTWVTCLGEVSRFFGFCIMCV